MQKWEICLIEETLVKVSLLSQTKKWVAYLLSPEGRKAIDESPAYGVSETVNIGLQLESLIAKLAAEGWEPMPVSAGQLYSGSGSILVHWYFKRAFLMKQGD